MAGVSLLLSCASKEEKKGEDASRATNLTLPAAQREKIKVETVAISTFRRALETTGTVAFDADQATSVLSPISGPVSRLLVSVGSPVKAGEPLATVASPDFATAIGAYRKADATARNTKRVAELDQKLFENDAISKREMQQAETDAISAESDRDAALLALRALGVEEKDLNEIREGRPVRGAAGTIRSPITGTVVEKLITPGQLLQAGTTPCFTVADLSTVWVMANIFESDLPFVSPGDPAQIRTNVTPEAFPGRVDYIAALVDPNTRAIAVRIVVKNPKRLLKKDLYVRVTLNSSKDSTGLLVPVTAVLRDDENLPFLFVANEDGSFARRPVTIGSQVGDRYEIRTGIRTGERIVVEGGLFMQFAQNQ
jgi:cobalt-zinc-cadmium efflux system membrane fusion protein